VHEPRLRPRRFGGRQDGGYLVPGRGGGATRGPAAEVITWPGDGDTEIPRASAASCRIPFPPADVGGHVSSATSAAAAEEPASGAARSRQEAVEILDLDKKSPICFCARARSRGKTQYTDRVSRRPMG
jgi:hypothetical protein